MQYLSKFQQPDFPGGPVVRNLTANAGDTGLNPGPGRSHMPWSSKSYIAQVPSSCAYSLCSTRGATTMRNSRTTANSSSCSLQLEKAHIQEDPVQPKNKIGLPWWLKWQRIRLHGWDPGLIPGSGRSPGEGNGYPLQYSCLENSMDRGAWQSTIHRATKNQTWLSTFHFKK